MTKAKHDQGYKALFSEPRMVEDLLRGFVPGEWVDQLDFSTLEKANSLFISEELLGREDDVIWRVRFKGRGWLYIFLILEFQSAPDPWMALRITVYQCMLWQDLIKQKIIKASDRLPPVVPVVLYNGEPPWDAPLELEELILPIEGLAAFRPKSRYLLLDEQRLALDEAESTRNLAAAVFRLEQSRTHQDIAGVVARLAEWLAEPEQASLRRAFLSWLRGALIPARLGGAPVPEVSELSEVRDMLQERVIQWTQEWKQQGIDEGRKEGIDEGIEKGRKEGEAKGKRDVLLMLLEQRGTSLTEEQHKRIDSCNDLALLDEWIRKTVAGISLDEFLD